MRKLIMSIAAAVMAVSGHLAHSEEPVEAFQSVVKAMELLRARGVITAAEGLENSLLKNLVKFADPGGALLQEGAMMRIEREAHGIWCVPKISFTKTNRTIAIIAPLPEGFESGDKLEMADGHAVGDLPVEEITRRLAGDCEEPARLTVRRNGSTEHELELARVEAPVPPVAVAEKLNPETGYVKLYGCGPGTAEAMKQILTQWKTSGVYGVVLDLRSAGGASREEVCRILGFFMPSQGELFRWVPLTGDPEICAAEGAEQFDLPTMVLTDEATAGAAELLAAALQSRETGCMIIGRKTAGDYLLRETLPLNDKVSLRVATRKLKFPDGREYEANKGLAPDIAIETIKGKATETPEANTHPRLKNDTTLQRACDVLQGLRVLKIEIREESKTPES